MTASRAHDVCAWANAKLDDETAFRRNRLGAVLLSQLEVSQCCGWGRNLVKQCPKAKGVNRCIGLLLKHEHNQALWTHYQRLIALRKTNPAFWSDSFEVIARLPDRGIIAFKRWTDEGNIVIVVANLMDHDAGEVEIPMTGLGDGPWHEAVYDKDVVVNQSQLVDRLGKSEAKIYIRR